MAVSIAESALFFCVQNLLKYRTFAFKIIHFYEKNTNGGLGNPISTPET